MRFLLVGLIVPHAPVLLPQVRGGDPVTHRLPAREEGSPLCILLSPHGSATGVHRRVRGNLEGFGISGASVERRTDRAFGKDLARLWRRPLLDADLDHGATVPLLIAIPGGLSVVTAALRGITGSGSGSLDEALDDARALASAVSELSRERDLIVAASAHTSAALSPAAPLAERPAGHELERKIDAALAGDVGLLAEIDTDLWLESGACGAATLTAFGLLFGGRSATVTFRESPFGVGYLLAQTA